MVKPAFGLDPEVASLQMHIAMQLLFLFEANNWHKQLPILTAIVIFVHFNGFISSIGDNNIAHFA